MEALAQRQLAAIERDRSLDCSNVADAGSNSHTRDTRPAPPFGTGTARSSPSGTFAHNVPGHTPKFAGFSSSVPRRSLPNRSWRAGRTTGGREEAQARPLQQVSPRQANAKDAGAQPTRRPASAGPRISISPAHAMALRREVTAIRAAKMQQPQPQAQHQHPGQPAPNELSVPAHDTRWLYSLHGQRVDELIEEFGAVTADENGPTDDAVVARVDRVVADAHAALHCNS